MPEDFISRPEYEARTGEMRTDIRNVGIAVEEVKTQVQALNGQFWKLIATTIINFAAGGGLVALLEWLKGK